MRTSLTLEWTMVADNLATYAVPGAALEASIWRPHDDGAWYFDLRDSDGHRRLEVPDSTARYGVEVADRDSDIGAAIKAGTDAVFYELCAIAADVVAADSAEFRRSFGAA